ncbi:MAG: cation-transporting P-type ATPase, partial [Salinibacter sp.]|uniref:cation-translocating P-type ATPase n=1 Tax=Salinibacter sp. TaxID=2065818 RepID=UPI002FC2B2A1
VGPNRLREIEHRSVLEILWEQFKSLVVLLLVVAMGVSFLFGQTVEGLAIAAVLAINTAIGFFTEWRAVRSMEALQQLGQVTACVRRDGQEEIIPADELVPGDIVRLRGGDLVPADLRLLDTDRLQVDESALTGESVPVAKNTEPVAADTPLAERSCMAYKGTAVAEGQGTGLVVATGMETELGAISAMVETAETGDTPLEQKLDRLGRRLVWLTLGIAAAVAGAGLLAGRPLLLMIETGIALAVAAIPEGLPIVATVALAHGMWVMLRRNAYVRRLSAVETLGATTLICTDKTGTLTENQMAARRLVLADRTVDLSTDARPDLAAPEADGTDPRLRAAIEVGALCNGAEYNADAPEESTGDPLELALLELGHDTGRARPNLLQEFPLVRTVAFDRDTKMMATYHEADDGLFVAVKGAPEAVLDACTSVIEVDGSETLSDEAQEEWLQKSENLAADGLRVLALARKPVDAEDAPPYEELGLLGLVALLDPPREDVRPVIERCQQAGIRVVMVTGDHPATAWAVAEAVGLDMNEHAVVEGGQFVSIEALDQEQKERLQRAAVYARVTPKQKLDLVDLYQDAGQVVAMTGDGVNDAPALRSADIGVAMGRRGTDVAREAADMVLRDDALSSVVAAVRQGRIIFDNIRKFVVYLLSGNVGEILGVGAAATVGLPLPLLPLQILYLNVLNDVFPALALGVGRGTQQAMDRPPRDPDESVVTPYHWRLIGGYGVLIAVTILGAFLIALYPLGMSTAQAVSVSFLTLSISRLLHVFNMRRPESGLFDNEISRTPYVWGALALCLGLLLLAVYWPPLAAILSVVPPGLHGWLLIGGASLVPLLLGQVYLGWRALWASAE